MTRDTHTGERQDTSGYENCVVAFLDILGFKRAVLKSQIDPDTFKKITEALKIVKIIPSGGKKVSTHSGIARTIEIRSRFFSDSLAFFLKKDPEDIAHLFFIIRYLQDQLWEMGFCLRGSLVLGKMYWPRKDDKVMFGKGLIDAHSCESTSAIYPRIVVSEGLFNYIEQERIPSEPFGSSTCTPLAKLILLDSDGVRFLDLLNPSVMRAVQETLDANGHGSTFSIRYYPPNDPCSRQRILDFIDRIIRDNKASEDDGVKQKYAWLQAYRDACDTCQSVLAAARSNNIAQP